MNYSTFKYDKNIQYKDGWNNFALKYSKLLVKDTIYFLTKKVMYSIMEQHIKLEKGMSILDFNCGTGNDFPYFLEKECTITGTDYSEGMLNKADEIYRDEIEKGNIKLLHGAIENLNNTSMQTNKYDLIYSITGGFSYVDSNQMIKSIEVLSTFLKPKGKIITAHFGRFSLAESLFYLFRLKIKHIFIRKSKKVKVSIKQKPYTLFLRTKKEFFNLSKSLSIDAFHPLLFFSPPYQTGYNPSVKRINRLYQLESKIKNWGFLSNLSDQFVVVISKKNSK